MSIDETFCERDHQGRITAEPLSLCFTNADDIFLFRKESSACDCNLTCKSPACKHLVPLRQNIKTMSQFSVKHSLKERKE